MVLRDLSLEALLALVDSAHELGTDVVKLAAVARSVDTMDPRIEAARWSVALTFGPVVMLANDVATLFLMIGRFDLFDHRGHALARVIIGNQIHRHLDLIRAEGELRRVAGPEDGTRQDLIHRHAQSEQRLSELARLPDPGLRQVPLSGTVAEPARVDFALIGGGVSEVDDLAAVLHGRDEHLLARLREGPAR